MERIPPEILQVILNCLDSKSQNICRKVCALWKDVVDYLGNITLYIGRKSRIWNSLSTPFYHNILIVQFVGATRCYLSQIDVKNVHADLVGPTKWKNPARVHFLWIDGFIHSATLRSIISELRALRKLEIHFSSLCSLATVDIDFTSLETLETFSIQMWRRYNQFVPCASVSRGLLNAIDLFQAPNFKFNKLTTFNSSFPLVTGYTHELCRSIVYFVLRQSITLRHLRMDFEVYGKTRKIMPAIGLPLCVDLADQLQLLRLESLSVRSIAENEPGLTLLDEVFNSQPNLTVLCFYKTYLDAAMCSKLLRNSETTLTKVFLCIHIDGTIQDYSPFCLCQFKECKSLKKLELINKEKTTGWDEAHLLGPELTGCSTLPMSLEIIRFAYFALDVVDSAGLVQEKPNLNQLKLIMAGQKRSYGIPFNISLIRLISRDLLRIDLWASVNEESIYESENSSDPILRTLAIQFANRPLHLNINRPGPWRTEYFEADYPIVEDPLPSYEFPMISGYPHLMFQTRTDHLIHGFTPERCISDDSATNSDNEVDTATDSDFEN